MANVETSVIAWLQALVGSGWPVSGDKPKTLPVKFILVDRTGGPREAMVLDRAEILIEVYHKDSRITASDLANEIADAIIGLEAYSDNITHAVVNSVVNLDDTLAQYHRYQIYCDVYNRR
jgi:hypothetical protein